jgi:hypothetical protein
MSPASPESIGPTVPVTAPAARPEGVSGTPSLEVGTPWKVKRSYPVCRTVTIVVPDAARRRSRSPWARWMPGTVFTAVTEPSRSWWTKTSAPTIGARVVTSKTSTFTLPAGSGVPGPVAPSCRKPSERSLTELWATPAFSARS